MKYFKYFLTILNNFPILGFFRNQWVFFANWLKIVHSNSDEASSKRFYGGIILLNCILAFDLFSAGVFSPDYWNILYSAWYSLLFIGFALLSISTVEKLAAVIANFKIQKIFEHSSKINMNKLTSNELKQ